MYTKEAISFDLLADMRTSYGADLFRDGVTVGENANLLFGPYIKLPSGKWTVAVAGQVDAAGPCYVDAAARQGKLILGQGTWQDGACDFSIECAFPVDEFEVRVYAASGSFVRIDSVSIERQIDTQGKRSFVLLDRMGLSLFLDRTSLVDRVLIETGSWEPEHLDFLTENAFRHADSSRDLIFLDIGAYFGIYSMILSRTNLFQRIVAFEADPLNFRQLCADLLVNDPACIIEPRFIAVSDQPGEALFASSLHHPDGNRGGVGVTEGTLADGDKQMVKADTIDRMVPIAGRKIFAKIDVEGHELKVLAGMRETLSRNKMFLQIETFHQLAGVTEILAGLGYALVNRIGDDYFFSNFDEA